MLTLFWFFLLWMGCGEPAALEKISQSGAEVSLPPALKDTTIRVHPATDVLPENGTTIRVYFSESIQLGGQRIQVTELSGEKLEGVLGRWVWNEERTIVRLEPEGLRPGTQVAIVVRGLKTESGKIITPFSKTFSILQTDETSPNGQNLDARLVDAQGPFQHLEVVFSEPIRWESLGALSVLSSGTAVAGAWRLGPHQTRAYFSPEAQWSESAIFISYGAGIHDLAGNQMTNTPAGMQLVGR